MIINIILTLIILGLISGILLCLFIDYIKSSLIEKIFYIMDKYVILLVGLVFPFFISFCIGFIVGDYIESIFKGELR